MILRKGRSTPALLLSFAALMALLAIPLSKPAFGQGTRQQSPISGKAALPGLSNDLVAKLEGIYKDIHANPELSMQERRTAGVAANWLREQVTRSPRAWAAPGSSGSCAMARAQPSCCGPTWTRCQ